MRITMNSIETRAGLGEWFTGAVYIDMVSAPRCCAHLLVSLG
jgi:hypothetical protein